MGYGVEKAVFDRVESKLEIKKKTNGFVDNHDNNSTRDIWRLCRLEA